MTFFQITRIDRYIFRQLFYAQLAVTTGLVALIWLTQSLRFIDTVLNRGLSMGVFLRLTGLMIPNFVAVILPITCFVVVQFVYQRLASDRELTVMRAAGLSQFALARAGLALALLTTLVCLLLNTWIVPASFTAFRQYQFEIRNRLAAVLLQDGVFNPVSDNLTIYVRTRDEDGTLHGLLIDDGRQPNSHATFLAETGRLVGSSSSPRVVMQNGSREELDRQTGRLNVLTFSEYVVDMASQTASGETRFRDVGEYTMSELINPSAADIALQRDVGKIKAELNRRLTTPFTAISFVMVALVAVLAGGFRRHGGLLRPIMGVLVVVALLAVGLALVNLAARMPSLLPLMWVHALLPGLAASMLLFANGGTDRVISVLQRKPA